MKGLVLSMNIRLDSSAEQVTAWLAGELDHHAARSLREQIDAAVERVKPLRLVLDFSSVNFMDSSGIGLVMGRYRLIKMMGGSLAVTGASPRIAQVMRMAGLERLGILESAAEGEGQNDETDE